MDQSYLKAHEMVKRLIDNQVLTLPSSKSSVTDPGATDAKYIKDLLTGLSEFYKNMQPGS